MKEYILMALLMLKKNYIRSLLTMLGIVIGIASVITVVCVGEGGSIRIQKELQKIGTQRIWVYAEPNNSLSERDEAYIKDLLGDKLLGISPINSSIAAAECENDTLPVSVFGVGEDYYKMEQIKAVYGCLPLGSMQGKVAITESMAKRLFMSESAIGKRLLINNSYYYIGAVVTDNAIAGDVKENKCYMSTGEYNMLFNTNSVAQYTMKLSEGDLDKAGALVCDYLSNVTGIDKIKSFNMSVQVETASQILGTLKAVLSCIALVCLLCGGIGVMNVMLIGVKERTMEIGVRKALGALDKQIKRQFIIESVVYSLFGGVFGLPIGILGAYAASIYIEIPFVVPFPSIIMGMGFSFLVGVFFGIYPAASAAKLRPVVALAG